MRNRFSYFNRHYHAHHRHQDFHYWQKDLDLSRKYIKVLRSVFFLVILILLYLIVRTPTNQLLTIFIGLLIFFQVMHWIWMTHLEKRIFKPMLQLQDGVKEIAKGNYKVKVNNTMHNEIGFLIDSFNEMAAKLLENEILKQEYEENRKALIANISHDLKTPITAIRGYLEALQDGLVGSPEKADQYLQVINKNAVYINRLIDDLLLFSKLDMHQLEFRMESVPVKDFMNDLMEEFSFELQERGCIFNYADRAEDNDPLTLDRKRIYQAIRNIIDNAVKYGPTEGLRLDITLYQKAPYICLDIQDNGAGIAEDKLAKIFERFYRVDIERTKDLGSTGLGLSIAREMVEAHGGKITVKSAVGEGSCFTIMLPAGERGES